MVNPRQTAPPRRHRGWHRADASDWISTRRKAELTGLGESTLGTYARKALRDGREDSLVRATSGGRYRWHPTAPVPIQPKRKVAGELEGSLADFLRWVRGPVESVVAQQGRLIETNARLVAINEHLVLGVNDERH